ncbi:MAG: TlpA family protein disulfide reductase [Elusimicrobia bacterium]|nr:TlpA family protein disulfide reductase [Elusimicrobiota bacterium]
MRSFPGALGRWTAVVALALLAGGCGRGTSFVGLPAPPARLELLQAPLAELKDWAPLAGKVVVLEFWATWCDSCLEELPHFNGFAASFEGRDVQFISVTDEPEADVRAFLKTHPIRGWVALDPDGSAFGAYRVRGRPFTVVIDRRGRVAGQTYPRLLKPEMLEPLLGGGGAAAGRSP